MIVWLGSSTFAGLAYFVVVGGVSLRSWVMERQRDREARQRIPSREDGPITVLAKLNKQDLGTWRDRVAVRDSEGELVYVYLL